MRPLFKYAQGPYFWLEFYFPGHQVLQYCDNVGREFFSK